MFGAEIEALIRRAVGGDPDGARAVLDSVADAEDPRLLAVAAVLATDAELAERAGALARTSRDRQIVAVCRAFVTGQRELVDALARDHLVDNPDSIIVAWVAACATEQR